MSDAHIPRPADVDIIVRAVDGASPAAAEVEVVERKGLGHPDTICDALAERICVALCRYYVEHCGGILHHNVDKILLRAGESRPAFGGGEVTAPIEMYLAGRATNEHRGARIPVDDIAVAACREWIGTHLHALDADGVKIIPCFRPGSRELTRLFGKSGRLPLANDTSCGVGFAPLTDLERVVLAVEHALNSPATKRALPAIGEDVKVMGVRRGSQIELTIACAMIGRFLPAVDDYVRVTAAARDLSLEAARRATKLDVTATVNAADDLEAGDLFLTVTGTSAESGDDGEAGRGNRGSGLITPYRAMTMESIAGKNPLNHVGKLYNLVAKRIAESVVEQIGGVRDATCIAVGRISCPIDEPQVVDVRLELDPARRVDDVRQAVRDLVRAGLKKLPAVDV